MDEGLFFGLAAGVCLGLANIVGAAATRRTGTLFTTVGTLVIALLLLAGYAIAVRLEFPADLGRLAPIGLLGAAAATGYVTFYQGLRIGPVSVVSAISATSGAATVAFAVVLLGEEPSLLQWLAIPVATLGAVLTSVYFVPRAGRPRLIGRGPLFAAISVVAGSISNAGLRVPIREFGWAQAILTQRLFTVTLVGMGLIIVWVVPTLAQTQRRNRMRTADARSQRGNATDSSTIAKPAAKTLDRIGVALVGLLGLVDAVAFVLFGIGLSVAPAWLVGMVSQSGRVAGVLGGLLFFGERLQPTQWLGVVLVVIGLVLAARG
jgi:drug/metabolite transporter (DMT)-like permease